MGLGVVLAEVVAVVGRHQRHLVAPGDLAQGVVGLGLLRDAVVLDLQEEVARAEDVEVVPDLLVRVLDPVLDDPLVDLPLEAGGEADQALGVLGQEVVVDPGLVVEALEVRLRGQLEEVLVAGLVLRQQHQVVVVAVPRQLPVGVLLRGDVGLDPEDRLDARLARLLVELDRPEHVAVVGQGHGGHLRLDRRGDHVVEAVGAVEEAELAVEVQVDEVGHTALVGSFVGVTRSMLDLVHTGAAVHHIWGRAYSALDDFKRRKAGGIRSCGSPHRYLRTKRRSMKSLSHQAQRPWPASGFRSRWPSRPGQESRARPSAVLRSER